MEVKKKKNPYSQSSHRKYSISGTSWGSS
jgi:hypothetical protein